MTILDDAGLAPKPVWTPQKRTFRKSNQDSAVTPVTTLTELPQFNRYNYSECSRLAGRKQTSHTPTLCPTCTVYCSYKPAFACLTGLHTLQLIEQISSSINSSCSNRTVLLTNRTAMIWVSNSTVLNPLRHWSNGMCRFLST